MELGSSRHLYFDTMRTISIYTVLIAHVYCPWIPKHQIEHAFPGLQLWRNWSSLIYTGSFVNIFFMISGALLLERQESLAKLYIRRVLRMLRALVVWKLLTIAVDRYWVHDEPKTEWEANHVNHLWFLSALIPLYMFLPFYRLFFINASNQIVIYMLIIWLVSVTLSYPYHSLIVDPVRSFTTNWLRIYLDAFHGHQGYMFFGALLQRYHTRIQNNGCFFIAAFCTYLMSNILFKTGKDLQPISQYNITPSVVIQTISMYVCLMAIGDWLFGKFPRVIASVSSASFGIYLSHKIILKVFKFYINQEHLAYNILPHSVFYNPVVTAILMLLSWAFVVCMKKMPIVRHIV